MRRSFIRSLGLACLGFAVLVLCSPGNFLRTAAATNQAPLLMQIGDGIQDDIFSLTDKGLKNLTNYGYNQIPILSPDGKQIAYASIAKTYVEDQATNGRSGAPAINIWTMAIATGDAKRIADQPPDTRAKGSTDIRPFTTRSSPRWSPDGKSLLWAEYSEGTGDQSDGQQEFLVVYDLASASSKKIFKQPKIGAGAASQPDWTPAGIIIYHMEDFTDPGSLLVLDQNAKQLSETRFDQPTMIQWLAGEKDPTLITQYELITVNDDSRSKTLPPLEIYSTSAPDGVRFVSDSGFFDAEWTIVPAQGKSLKVGKLLDWAISPDGKQAAYVTDAGLFVFDGSKSTQVDLSTVKLLQVDQPQARGLAWGNVAIRISTRQ